MSAFPPVLLFTLGGVVLLLALVSAALAVLVARGRLPREHELVRRTRSWWVLVGVVGTALLAGRGWTVLLFALASFLALKEFFTLLPVRPVDRSVLLWAYLAIPLQYWWVYTAWYGMFLVFVPVYMFLLVPALMVLQGETREFLRVAGTVHFALMSTVFALSHAALLVMLPDRPTVPAGGVGLLLFLLLVTEGNDVLQYVTGRLLGRRRLAPAVSPGKTLEGFLGGLLGTTLLGLALAPPLTPWRGPTAALLGAGLATAGLLGDLTVSAIKRDLGVKDAGDLLPGHGGILDRVDSLVFTAPLFFHVTWYAHY